MTTLRNRTFALVAIAVGLLLFAAVALFTYDSLRADRIAEGLTVGGVEVGGMTEGEAEREIETALVTRLGDPVTVRLDGASVELDPARIRLGVNVDRTIDAAIEQSREGTIFERVYRELTGGDLDVNVDPVVVYSRPALAGWVMAVRGRVNREPRDAAVDFESTDGITIQEARDGVAINTMGLFRDLEAAVRSGGRIRAVQIPARRTEPAVATEEVAGQYPYLIKVDRANFELQFYKDLRLVETYTIAIGQVGFDTPAGLYHIQNKAVDPAWHVPDKSWAGELAGQVIPGGAANNPLKERWMGIYDGAGIHGTDEVDSLGTAASHGCIRMDIPDVIELYDEVPEQTPIYIA